MTMRKNLYLLSKDKFGELTERHTQDEHGPEIHGLHHVTGLCLVFALHTLLQE